MKTVTTMQEFQDCIDEVKRTKQSMKVANKMSDEEKDKTRDEINMDGVDVIVFSDHDEIKPLS